MRYISLLPLVLFLTIYLGGSVIAGDFYKIPMTVAFLLSSAVAIMVSRGNLNKRIKVFSAGASDRNIMLMVWIYVMAGAFASVAKEMGAVDATVGLTMSVMPASMVYVGLFVASAFVSLAIGTSVGTIVALTPIAVGMAGQMGETPAEMAAIVVGGAYFGDNLSFISDTTIAATQTQGCKMADKFRMNMGIIWPAVVVMLIVYIMMGREGSAGVGGEASDVIAVLPYVVVIAMSLMGCNVLMVLGIGIVTASVIGIADGRYDIWGGLSAIEHGIGGMGDLIVVALLAGGMLEVVRANGGIRALLNLLRDHIGSRRSAEAAIGASVMVTNLCTANNTVAIITVGRIVHDMAERYGVDPRRAASLLDTCSCTVQGLLPYGVQMLLASRLADCSPLEIVPHLYYPMLIGLCSAVSIITGKTLNLRRY